MKNLHKRIGVLFLVMFIFEMNLYKIMAQKIDKEEISNGVVMPLDSVPCWVKRKVTQEEYTLWKTMSHIFRINYSFLKQELSEEKQKLLYEDIKKMCELIEKGEYSDKKGELFTVSLPAPIDTTLEWKVYELSQIEESIQFCKRKAVIYQSEYLGNASLECSIWYIYNSQKKEVNILKYEIISPFPFSRFQGEAAFFLQKNRIYLEGNCSGNLQYYDKSGKYYSEIIYKRFIIPL